MQSNRRQQSVLVVGAGPVGLVAACELARQGITPRLIDALPAPTKQYRAVGVQPRSLEMLDALGVVDQLLDLALPQVAIQIDAPIGGGGFKELVRVAFAGVPSRHPQLMNLPQTDTEAILRARAADLGVAIEQGVKLTSLRMDDSGVDVVLDTAAGPERAHVDWIIGADGGHSTVRKLIGAKLDGNFRGTHFIVADVSIDTELPRDTTRLFTGGDGLTVIMCMQHNRSRLLFQIPDPGADAPPPTLVDVQRLASARIGDGIRIYQPESISRYTIHHAQVPEYRLGRALLAGDAAHIHSPAGGQGMNTGMQDAANLAWKLALVCQGKADPALMDSYHDERHPVGAAVVRRTTLMANTMTLTGPAAGLRNAALLAAGHSTALRHALAESITETNVAYHHSPITARTGPRTRRGQDAGSYSADLPHLVTTTGDPISIGDLLRRPGHLLLALSTDPATLADLREAVGPIATVVPVVTAASGAPGDAIVDTRKAIAAQYGIGPHGFVLIRPDGYIGYVSDTSDLPRLRDYLHDRLRLLQATAKETSAETAH
jgi:2-polyprenyl-6-methoxyphenol hydroxylase-like FAD-dependent oxidoreductase